MALRCGLGPGVRQESFITLEPVDLPGHASWQWQNDTWDEWEHSIKATA